MTSTIQRGKNNTLVTLLYICIIVFFLSGLYQLFSIIAPRWSSYVYPYYTESVYKSLESAFNSSQYRQKANPGIIPDETVYSYAAGAYLHGRDPILINSERTPLGKYIMALSILVLKNDKFIVLPFGLLTLMSVWLLARQVFHDDVVALVPVAILCYERLFLDQFIYTPLLDILHIPLIFLTIYVFSLEYKKGMFWKTSILIGLVIATKTVYSGLLLVAVFLMYLFIQRMFDRIWKFIVLLPISCLVLLCSYAQTFLHGYTLMDFIGFQKWILLYDKSKLLYPFSIWRLVFFNQWQTWWGDMRLVKAADWQFTWPLFTTLTLLSIVSSVMNHKNVTPAVMILSLWFVFYGLSLSLGIASSRFLLPILPVVYILGCDAIIIFIRRLHAYSVKTYNR